MNASDRVKIEWNRNKGGILRDQRGFLTLDFIFSLMIAFGFSVVFFSVSITLSMVEVTQYIAYSTSRSYAGAHESHQSQQSLAHRKYDEIVNLPTLKNLFGLNWIVISSAEVGDFNDQYPLNPFDHKTFVGARIPFQARILNLNLPFLGQTANNSTTGRATISSYLMREVSTQECREGFNRQRYRWLKQTQIDGATPYQAAGSDDYPLITDNGC